MIGKPGSTPKRSTMEQLRRMIGSDGAKDRGAKHEPAPAASSLGTDDEAGGTTPTAERIEMARFAEEKIKTAAKTKS